MKDYTETIKDLRQQVYIQSLVHSEPNKMMTVMSNAANALDKLQQLLITAKTCIDAVEDAMERGVKDDYAAKAIEAFRAQEAYLQ